MLTFIKDEHFKGDDIRYHVYRNGKLLKSIHPCNDDTKDDIKWAKLITKTSLDFINYDLLQKKGKPLTETEEKQLFNFYYMGPIEDEIKKHQEEIKKLQKKLKGRLK